MGQFLGSWRECEWSKEAPGLNFLPKVWRPHCQVQPNRNTGPEAGLYNIGQRSPSGANIAQVKNYWPKAQCGVRIKCELEYSFKGPTLFMQLVTQQVFTRSLLSSRRSSVYLAYSSARTMPWSCAACILPHMPDQWIPLPSYNLTANTSSQLRARKSKTRVHIWGLFFSLWTSEMALF